MGGNARVDGRIDLHLLCVLAAMHTAGLSMGSPHTRWVLPHQLYTRVNALV
jgi:hypothetical protein